MSSLLQILALILCTSAYACGRSGSFLILSDIHFDPYFDPKIGANDFCRDDPPKDFVHPIIPNDYKQKHHVYGKYGCDSPYMLLESAFTAMQIVDSDPDFILVMGDTAAHYLDTWKDVVNTVQNLTQTLSFYFPGVPILPIMGNNDAFPDYQMPFGPTKLLEHLYSVWSAHGWLESSGASTFINGGFYSQMLFGDLKIIALNTLFYSKDWCSDNTTKCTSGELAGDDPAGQFAWLQNELAAARQNAHKVFILGHIPPGADKTFKPLWVDDYVTSYQQIVTAYNDVIELQLFSHLHRDSFRLLFDTNENLAGGIVLTSSLSPKDLNNPSFRVASYNTSSYEVLDYTVCILI